MSQYKTIATTPAGAPAVTMVVPPAAHTEPNKPGNPAKAEHTTELVKEKIEPGRDIFASPIQDNKVNVETTGGVDPVVLEEEKKVKEEKMRSEIEKLMNKVGPLSPSEVVAKAAIEKAEFDAIVKDPLKDDAKPKAGEQKAESTAPRREEKTNEETEEKTDEKVTEEKPEHDDKEEDDGSMFSIQPAPSSTHGEDGAEKEKKPLSPEEVEAERVRQVLYGKEKE